MEKVLAVDVGFAATGLAVMEESPMSVGVGVVRVWVPMALYCLRTEKMTKKVGLRVADDDVRRVADLARGIVKVIDEHQIRRALVEVPGGGGRAARPVRCMALATGMIAAVLELRKVAWEVVTPDESRKAACGCGNPSKDEVIAAMGARYPTLLSTLSTKAEREHVADALATFEAGRNGVLCRL